MGTDSNSVCQEGLMGDGTDCLDTAWGVRTVFEIPEVSGSARGALSLEELERLKVEYVHLLTGYQAMAFNDSMMAGMPLPLGPVHFDYHDSCLGVETESAAGQLTLIALFANETRAENLVSALQPSQVWLLLGSSRTVIDGPEVYSWVASSVQEVNPTGLTVDRVYFEPSCLASGCWKVDVTYPADTDNFNVFYLPKTNGNDKLSSDNFYDTPDVIWEMSPDDTFETKKHPCHSFDYVPSTTAGMIPAQMTSCCIPQFLAMYRPVKTFPGALHDISGLLPTLTSVCSKGDRARDVPHANVPIFAQRGEPTDEANFFPKPEAGAVPVLGLAGDSELFQLETNSIFVSGVFEGMAHSYINHTGSIDQSVGLYTATLWLDEMELRTLAGKLRGTVGVEHAVDTFVGMVEFSPTGSVALHPNAVQVNIHLERTNFFSVSTHGTNQYAVLEHVNMRLVLVYAEDLNLSGKAGKDTADDEATHRTVRTSPSPSVAFIQVTFTLGPNYSVNANPDSDRFTAGLIPLDSVRVGRGTSLDEVEAAGGMQRTCSDYYPAASDTVIGLDLARDGSGTGQVARETFDGLVGQTCGPQSSMCESPSSVPGSFVSFNIPLGTEIVVVDDDADDDSRNIFVSMVVNALDGGTDTPGGRDAPDQMKTTLSASIPIATGGISIFCDGVTAKTDLKDVADVDIVVGTTARSDLALFFRDLRILQNIASTDLAELESQEDDDRNLESSLMTLVLKGDDDYFRDSNINTGDYTLELDDVITLHLMDDERLDKQRWPNPKEVEVLRLLRLPGYDSADTTGLDTNGFALNGAFEFRIERDSKQARLEPTDGLLAVCPFNPPRPSSGNVETESCITRRDVKHRGYPVRTGSVATAMEILASSRTDSAGAITIDDTEGTLPKDSDAEGLAAHARALTTTSPESDFMVTILGNSDYSRRLAVAFADVIRAKYDLNGRYRRAYWINPGYEWTRSQTGTWLFSVSTKVYLFALVSLDEHWQRRRMLLQSVASNAPEDNSAAVSAASIFFGMTKRQLMCDAFRVPKGYCWIFDVALALTEAEACMTPNARMESIRETFVDYVSQTASAFHTVAVIKMSLHLGSVRCPPAAGRRLLSAFSLATADVRILVVFKTDTTPSFDPGAFADLPGIIALTPSPYTPVVEGPGWDSAPLPCLGCGLEPDSESGPSNVALVAGVVGGALAVAAAVMLYLRNRADGASRIENRGSGVEAPGDDIVPAVQTIHVADLKEPPVDEV